MTIAVNASYVSVREVIIVHESNHVGGAIFGAGVGMSNPIGKPPRVARRTVCDSVNALVRTDTQRLTRFAVAVVTDACVVAGGRRTGFLTRDIQAEWSRVKCFEDANLGKEACRTVFTI